MFGRIGDFIDKIYIIKPGGTTHTFRYNYLFARWVSPRFSSIKIDRYIDIPYANITFFSIFAIGDEISGDRFIELGVFGIPKTIRCPFTSLSANEFRFPSKNIDTNLRHVGFEILKNCRYLAMPEETFRFLNQKPIKAFENELEATAHISSTFSSIEKKLPFKCEFCKKILWLYGDRIPDIPHKAKCPVCQSTFLLEKPENVDFNLIRFFSSGTTPEEKEKAIVTPGGEIKILQGNQEEVKSLEVEEEIPTNEDDLNTLPEEELSITDEFLDEILPDTFKEETEKEKKDTEAIEEENAKEVDEGKVVEVEKEVSTCPVCGRSVSEKEVICPYCGSALELKVTEEPENIEESSGIDIKLKDELEENKEIPPEHLPEEEEKEKIEDVLPEEKTEEKKEEKEKKVPYWEEKVWYAKIEEDIYEELDLMTLEDWVLSRSLLEDDLIRKGTDGKWVKAKDVPYLKTAFERVRNAIELGVDVSAAAFFPARNLKRAIAFIIDSVIIGVLGFIGHFFIPASMAQNYFITVLYTYFLPLIYLTIPTAERGQTLGKRFTGLHVITKSAKPPSFSKSLLRAIVWLISFSFFGIIFLLGLIHPKKRALHDMVAGTFVVEYE